VRFHNRAYRAWLRKPRTAIDGSHARDVLGEEAFSQTEAYSRRALAGEAVSFERVHVGDDGAERHLAGRFVPHRAADGKVAGYVALLVDVTERKAAEAKIAALASTDALTGLPNRRSLVERLEQAVPLALRRQGMLALLFVDLDGFKGVNDSLGHEAGDRLLVEVARRLQAVVRRSDTVARPGGDEFIVLLIDPGPVEAIIAKAESLIAAIQQPVAVAGAEARVGASIGIALCPDHATTPETLTRKADLAMYEAKRAGKGRWQLAT
jgi:diguanylate cyclase (GGDEF)-like protein/PAS domain S-box-containing protein